MTSNPTARANQTPKIQPPTDANGGPRHELLAAEVLDKAASLFAAQGFASTSLKDIADAVGLQRSSIYYYYPSKDALLEELIKGVTAPVFKIFAEVEASVAAPVDRIREVVRRLVIWVADPKTHFRLMDRSEADLPEAIAKAHGNAKRHVLKEMMRLLDAAVASGEVRALDVRITALCLIGMAMWTAWWHQPGPGNTINAIADLIADNAVASLRRPMTSTKAATLADLTNDIRNNLDLIDQMAAGRR